MKRLAAIALVVAALAARAATTNEVVVAALLAAVDAGLSETNGWTMSGLGKYAKGADYSSNIACVKFDTKGDWLESKDFGARIIGIEFVVRCTATNNATRFLYVRDMGGANMGVVATCSMAKRCESTSLAFGQDANFSQFRIVLDGSDNTGVWGIGSLKVITADPVYAPTDVRVSRKGDGWCALAWENGENTVSNRIDAFVVERSAEGETVVMQEGFDLFAGNSGGNKDVTGDLQNLIGNYASGVNVYALAATNGICYLGQTRELGILRLTCCDSYRNARLRIVAKRYPTDNAETTIAYELGGATNEVDTLTLGDEFAEHVVDLSRVEDGAALLIGYYKKKSNRRVLIDSLSIVRAGTVSETRSGSAWIPAAQGAASFSTRNVFDFPARAECRFEVRAQNADGILSEAAGVEAKLGGTPGARLVLR